MLNRINRNFAHPTRKEFTVYYHAAQLSKPIKVIVHMTDPKYSLQTNDNINIFLSPDEENTKSTGYAPLYLKNVGDRQITALQISPAD